MFMSTLERPQAAVPDRVALVLGVLDRPPLAGDHRLLLNGVGTLMLDGLGLAIFLRHGKPAGNGGEPVEIG
jgi:hypothetical protein